MDITIVKAVFGGLRKTRTAPVYRDDHDLILQLVGVRGLPVHFQAHFANTEYGTAVVMMGSDGEVTIPNSLLATGLPIYCWVIVEEGISGRVTYSVQIPVRQKARPDGSITPEQADIISQAITALNDAGTAAQEAADSAAQSAEYITGVKDDLDDAIDRVGVLEEAKETTLEAAGNAEAWAVGNRGGSAVPSTDPAYHNNSKYYAEQAAESLRDIGGKTAYSSTNIADVSIPVKGYQVNSLGRVGSNSKACVTKDKDDSAYWYKGSTFAANEGYLLSYSFWRQIITADISVENRIAMARDVSAGVTITVPQDCYVLVSARKADDSDIPTGKTAAEFLTDALTINVFYKSLKSEIDVIRAKAETIEDNVIKKLHPDVSYSIGCMSTSGTRVNYKNRVLTSAFAVRPGDYVEVDTGYTANMLIFRDAGASTWIKTISMSEQKITADIEGYAIVQIADSAGWSVYSVPLADTRYQNNMSIYIYRSAYDALNAIDEEIITSRAIEDATDLHECQRSVAVDWHFPFVDIANNLGLGSNHQIPGTATTWSASKTVDLVQKDVWMSDGTHPFKGSGVTGMYALAIAQSLALVPPSFKDTEVSANAPYWTGKKFLWMGTSIPAGSDPNAGSGTGSTYPALVAQYLGATVYNIARGSSCVRANASDGEYTGFMFSHFIRSITRMDDECDYIAEHWDEIKTNILLAPETLEEGDIATMKAISFENLLMPYLDGTNAMPDLFVIDYGHNDVRPRGIDGMGDLWVKPTISNINNGILAEDTYMTANNYQNLKLAMGNDLSGISDIMGFAASVNRNCLQGALNFLITVILSRNPYARIAIISDYN